MVLFGDSAAAIGLAIAAVGIAASQVFERSELDGAASIGIGLLLAAVAMFLAVRARLLIGEPAASEVVASIRAIALAQPGVERVMSLFTVHLGPDQIVAAIAADFKDSFSAADVESAVAAIEDRVRAAHPQIVLLLIKPQGGLVVERARAPRLGGW
jgi:divalent metal cation (Fe/Co/Zn/Cd) transporter